MSLALRAAGLGGRGMRNLRLRCSSCMWTRWLASGLLPAIAMAVLTSAPASAFGQSVVTTVGVGVRPTAIAVNPVTNAIYVADSGDGTVVVIHGATSSTCFIHALCVINVGTNPVAIAVNPVTDKIYVVNGGSNNVTVIDPGNANATTPVSVRTAPGAEAMNPVTNKVYLAECSSDND